MLNRNSASEEPDSFASCTIKKKRSLPGHPDPDAEVIALSPRSLMATNRFVCEICNKGFQRDQNLQLHRRGHNLPWRLKQKATNEPVKRKVYICPEATCVHHDPGRALGDLTGIKKHFSRKHGEKKWKCDKCSKRYAVQSDWKAHQKTCGTREYRCDCGTVFSRRDSFITHRAFCDALAEENAKISTQRQGESQETTTASHVLDHNSHIASFRGDLSAAMRAPSSPTSQITRDTFAYTEVSKPLFTDRRASEFASPEGIMASKWMPSHGSIEPNVAASIKSPGLSLYLGMGLGPGPPCSGGSPFDFRRFDALHKLHIPSSQAYDAHMQSASSSMDAMGMLSSLFSYPKHAYTESDVGNGMLGALGYYPEFMRELDESSATGQLSMPSSRRLSVSMPSITSRSENQSKGSSHHVMSSATALLQKAAQIGVTASNPSLLQKFGIGGVGAETRNAQDMQRQPPWQGVSSMFSISNTKPRQTGEYIRNDVAPDRFAPTLSGYGSMQEFMDSVSGRGNESLKNACNHMPSSTGFAARSSLSSLPTLPGMRSSQVRELEEETPMVDFLGVGVSSGMVGFFRNQDGKKSLSAE